MGTPNEVPLILGNPHISQVLQALHAPNNPQNIDQDAFRPQTINNDFRVAKNEKQVDNKRKDTIDAAAM